MLLLFRVFFALLVLLAAARAQVGLVAAFPCNEGTGTTITDLTATQHVGTLSGAGWTAQGKYGSALVFDGVNDWVTIPDANALDLTTGATVMAWVYPTALGGYRTVVMKETPGGAAYYLYSGPGNLAMGGGGFNGGGYRETSGGAVLPLNTWTHLATTYDGANVRVYRNGALVATLAGTGPYDQSASPLRLGGNATWDEWWQGRIDEVRVYNRALSAAEIAIDRDTPLNAGPTAPLIASVAPPQGAAVRSLAQIDVAFSEPVTGVDAADLLVGAVPASGVSSLGGNAWRFTFPAQPTGAVSVAFAASHGIVDLENPPVAFAGGAWSYTIDPNAPLEPVRINEVVAANVGGGLTDQDGDLEDWVELLNTGTTAVNLAGWALTDDAAVPGKWIFPARTLAPGEFLIVFLSEKIARPRAASCMRIFR